MKLYVPEIGDQLTLTEDWTFNLHAERRNTDLAAHYGHYIAYYDGWIDESVLPQMRDYDFVIEYPERPQPKRVFEYLFSGPGSSEYDDYNKKCEEIRNNNPEYVKWHLDHAIWKNECNRIKKESLLVTIPKGSILGVDRIYIRKGAKDFSSITFYAKGLPTVTIKEKWSKNTKQKKALRFWAKLSECNEINFK